MLVDAVIVAAGSSTRFGAEDKLTAALLDRPVLAWSIAAFGEASSIGGMVIVAPDEKREWAEELGKVWGCGKRVTVVPGGARRRDSVGNGLAASRSRYVAVHDGARPLVTAAMIDRVVNAAEGQNGALLGTAVTDSIKEVQDGLVAGHPERSRLWAAQTPQVVLRQAWLDAASTGDDDETDDAAMLSRLGLECVAVESGEPNLKITRPLDLQIAELILKSREVGR